MSIILLTSATVVSAKAILQPLYSLKGQCIIICIMLHGISLTHWSWDKMAAVLQPVFSNAFSWTKNVWILIKLSLNFVPKGLINNIPLLVQIWLEPSHHLNHWWLVYWHIYASLSLNEFKPSVTETWIFLWNNVNIMAADALAPCVAKTSVAMVLIHKIDRSLSSKGKFQLTAECHC